MDMQSHRFRQLASKTRYVEINCGKSENDFGIKLFYVPTTFLVQFPIIVIAPLLTIFLLCLALQIWTYHDTTCRSFCRAGMPKLFFGCHEYIGYLGLLREYREMGYDVDRIDVSSKNK